MSWTKLINFQKTELFFLLATSTMQRALSRRSDTSDAEMDGLGKVVFKTSYYFQGVISVPFSIYYISLGSVVAKSLNC